jgi:hypothetical protein
MYILLLKYLKPESLVKPLIAHLFYIGNETKYLKLFISVLPPNVLEKGVMMVGCRIIG